MTKLCTPYGMAGLEALCADWAGSGHLLHPRLPW